MPYAHTGVSLSLRHGVRPHFGIEFEGCFGEVRPRADRYSVAQKLAFPLT